MKTIFAKMVRIWFNCLKAYDNFKNKLIRQYDQIKNSSATCDSYCRMCLNFCKANIINEKFKSIQD